MIICSLRTVDTKVPRQVLYFAYSVKEVCWVDTYILWYTVPGPRQRHSDA